MALRIAYFTESLPPLTDGVARTYTWLAQALDEAGDDFRFVSPMLPAEAEPWRGRVIKQASFAFPLYQYCKVALPWPPRLYRELDAFGPQLIQVAAPTPLGWAGINYARRRGLPVVSSYHTHFTDYFQYYGLGFLQGPGWELLRRFHNATDRTYAPSRSALQRLDGEGIQRLELWERGLDASLFSPERRSAAERGRWAWDGELLVLYVGRLVADKDLRVLADALRAARQRGLRLRAVFAGDGPLKAELQARLPEDHFPGFLHGEDLARLYASADVFAFASPNETFGNVVLEAMASGLPVLAVKSGGPADLVDHGRSGWLVEPGNPAALALGLGRLGTDPGLRRSLAAHGLATAQRYHWREVHGRLRDSYRAVLAQKLGTSAVAPAPGALRV
jgi:glycosyltransferase involved in cell wall biosynthesis